MRKALAIVLVVTGAAGCGGKVVLDGSGGAAAASSNSGTTSSGVVGTSSGGGATSTVDVSSSSSGGMCTSPADCPTESTACYEALCTDGLCGITAAPAGTACTDSGGTVCNAFGQCVACNTAADCPTLPTPCFANACTNNVCAAQNVQFGKPCGTGEDEECDGMGNCVVACLENCVTEHQDAFDLFVADELQTCACASSAEPCASECAAECANPPPMFDASSPCGMCLLSQIGMGMGSMCVDSAGVNCLGNGNCAPFVNCGLMCP